MKLIEQTIGRFVDKKCNEFKDREALVFPAGNKRYTFKEFKTLYDTIAKGLLSLGIKKGDHIALLSLNSPLWIAVQIASAKLGANLVCVNTGYNKNELEYVLEHSESTTLLMVEAYKKNKYFDSLSEICPEIKDSVPGNICSDSLPRLKNVIMLDNSKQNGTFTIDKLLDLAKQITEDELEEALQKVHYKDIANIYYTSGTTGKPKAVMLNHFVILNNALQSGKQLGYNQDDRLLLCLPLFHVILSAFSGLITGAVVVIAERFSTEKMLQYIEAEKCTVLNCVPTMFKLMLDCDKFNSYDVSSVSKGFIAGSCCSPELIIQINQRFHMCLLNVYGQTEAIAICQTQVSDSHEARIKTIGKPIAGITPHIVNPETQAEVFDGKEGELCVDTIYLMDGYYKNEEATRNAIDEKGWLHTGDLAFIDNKGYIRIKGRIKDIIIRGGENIAPSEIEDIVVGMDAIKDVAIVGIPDEVMGEEMCAFVILKSGQTATPEEIKAYIQSRLAKYKVPKHIEFVEKFPVTSSGKVQKYMLREYYLNKYSTYEEAVI